MTDVLSSPALVLALIVLHEAGKALTHSARDAKWARRPLLPGLAITDFYHACSGVQWLLVLWACWTGFGQDWRWWAAAAVAWALIWPASKAAKGLGTTAALGELWYVQIWRWLWRR